MRVVRSGRRNTPRRIIRLGSSGPSATAILSDQPAEKLAGAGGRIASAGVSFAARRTAMRRSWWHWLLDHYLFVRLPLVRPAAWLARTLPRVWPIWSPPGVALLATFALIGLWLAAAQWDSFTGSFAALLTPQGLAIYGAALLFVKAFHECGHAFMATRFGARVPAMGVSLLVMMPVLYTDTSAAWRLRSRSERRSRCSSIIL